MVTLWIFGWFPHVCAWAQGDFTTPDGYLVFTEPKLHLNQVYIILLVFSMSDMMNQGNMCRLGKIICSYIFICVVSPTSAQMLNFLFWNSYQWLHNLSNSLVLSFPPKTSNNKNLISWDENANLLKPL